MTSIERLQANHAAQTILLDCLKQLKNEYTFWVFLKNFITGKDTKAWNTLVNAMDHLFRDWQDEWISARMND